jgi:protein-tyrosine-phosphatase/DNA-binding MarR family transcriptional regulator
VLKGTSGAFSFARKLTRIGQPMILTSMSVEVSRDLIQRASVFAALGDPHRLRVVELLTSSDLTPSQLAVHLGIGSNLLAHHLRILEDAGVVESLRSEGDGRRRYLRLVHGTVGTLEIETGTLTANHVLFVCTGNSARSQLAAAMWSQANEIPAESAGTHPATKVHPLAVRAGKRAGLDLTSARPRTLAEVVIPPDLVVTVCDRAYEELARSETVVRTLHWSVPDPVHVGSAAAFGRSLDDLERRVSRLAPYVVPSQGRRPRKRTRP